MYEIEEGYSHNVGEGQIMKDLVFAKKVRLSWRGRRIMEDLKQTRKIEKFLKF